MVGCWHGYVWSEAQTCIYIHTNLYSAKNRENESEALNLWPSWCHCHSLSLASVKSRLVLPFWYRLTRVVPLKGPLNGCCVCVCHDRLNQELLCTFWRVYMVLRILLFKKTAIALLCIILQVSVLFCAFNILREEWSGALWWACLSVCSYACMSAFIVSCLLLFGE